jgi:hypothetical protein
VNIRNHVLKINRISPQHDGRLNKPPVNNHALASARRRVLTEVAAVSLSM